MNATFGRKQVQDNLMIGREILYLTKQQVMDIGLSTEDILQLTREALIEHGHKRYEMPAKIGVHPYSDVFYHAMPAYVPSKEAVGAKWIECYPRNPKEHDLPQTTGLLIINDVETGAPVGLMDSTWITAVRTPAVTVLAAEAFHPDAETFGMFGCGIQGIEHVNYVVHTLKNLKKIYVHDIRDEAMDRLVREVQPLIDVEIVKGSSAEQVAKSCEVLCSATIILKDRLSIVKDEWVSKGQTILPCDLNTFWDPQTAQRADKYIVDSIEEHELFAGMGYFPEGLPNIYGETGEVLAGLKVGRANSDELIVNSNIGMAVCDVVVGKEIFNRAVGSNTGTRLSL